jgi:hypothetical protein
MASIFAMKFDGSIPISRDKGRDRQLRKLSGVELNELIELVRLED